VKVRGGIAYRASETRKDYTHRDPVVVVREGRGTLVGEIVVDTVLGLRAAGSDTLHLEGTATLVLQDGRRFSTPARWERARRWTLRDSAAHETERARRLAEARRTTGGMVIPPPTGDAAPPDSVDVDSLWAAWDGAIDPDERVRIGNALHRAEGGGRDVLERRMAARRSARGDTAALWALLSNDRWNDRWTADRYAELHTVLDDPGLAWRFGIQLGWGYQSLVRVFEGATPLRADSSEWACLPDDCRAILDRMATGREPRLREIEAVGRFMRDPTAGWERILAFADAGSTLVDGAVRAGRGSGARSAQGAVTEVPPPGAPWRAWMAWIGSVQRPRSARTPIYTARTGRDPLDEIEERWPDSRDSARVVFGALLRDAGRLPPPTAVEVHADLTSGSGIRATAARRELVRFLREGVVDTLPASETGEFVAPVLDSILAFGSVPWRLADSASYRPTLGQGFHGARDVPVRLLWSEGLPSDVADGRPVTLVDSATWANRDLRSGAVLIEFAPVRRAGDLVFLDWTWWAWFPREPDETPEGYAGGESVWLARTEDGWVVVQTGAWIT
jgi:hypothetical protein